MSTSKGTQQQPGDQGWRGEKDRHEQRILVITGGLVVTDADESIPPLRADLVVVDGVITELGEGVAAGYLDRSGVEVLDASDRLVVPGLVNSHYHSHDTLAKGTMEQVPLDTWGMRVLPPKFTPRSREEIKVRTLIGALECLRFGITTVQDMVTLYPFDPEHLDAVIEAYNEIGLRAVIAPQYADVAGMEHIPYWEEVFPADLHVKLSAAAEPEGEFDLLDYLADHRFPEQPGPCVTWALGPSTPESCSTELIERTVALAERFDIPIFSHLYESKSMALQARMQFPEHDGSLVKRMQAEGMLGPRVSLVHSVWLLDEEIELLAQTGTNVVFNPMSNLKLKCGIPPILEVQEAGVPLALGCDNSSATDTQNMFTVMKLAALLASVSEPGPTPPQAGPIFAAATRGGARTVGMSDQLGRLAVGYRADLMLIDLTEPSWLPFNNAVRQLVYTESGAGVRVVVVDGRVVIRDGHSTLIDEAQLRRRLAAVLPGYLAEFEGIAEQVAQLEPYLLEAHELTWKHDVGTNRVFTGR